MLRIKVISLLFISVCSGGFSSIAQTTVSNMDGEWKWLIDGEVFDLKGVTFGYDEDVANYEMHMSTLQSMGVNSIRTWATGEHTMKLLDAAERFGIKVMVGIWMRHGRPGMEADDSFNYLEDREGMEAMYENALDAVQKYKSHPAVLSWGVGNEVYLNMETDEEKVAYSKLLERICREIKQVDPDHPIVSVEAWTFGLKWWETYVPSLDVYGINVYGAGANVIPEEFKKAGVSKPYVITEFGVTGEWDAPKDENAVTVEPTDQQKYDAYSQGYNDWIKSKSTCLGAYMFHYADGDQFVAPWLLTHYKGKVRPQYWAIREAYTGQKPTNEVPVVQSLEVPGGELESESWMPVSFTTTDAEGEPLTFAFHYNQRSGSRKRRDQLVPLNFRGSLTEGFEVQLPKEHGAIKLYVNAMDTYGNVGIATASVLVKDEELKDRKHLVPKATLPFYVYDEGEESPYIPSGLMGNYKSISVDLKNSEVVYEGESAIEISYSARDNWYGVGFVDPPNDWGQMLGGYDLTGAKKFSFWAKANDENVTATIGFGLIKADQPYPDTSIKSKVITLSTEWKQYSLSTKKNDMSCIRTGFVLFSSSSGFPHKIYLDEIVFE